MNPRAYELASELARLTGESLTQAAITALEQRLAAETERRSGRSTAERMLEFADRFSAHVKPGSKSGDHADLYGEDGLPR